MADRVTFELVSPEKKLASRAVSAVTIPGMQGELTAMADHVAFLTTLRPGFVTISGEDGQDRFFVTGGFAEISGNTVSVLAEQAADAESLDAAWIDARIEEAEHALASAAQPQMQAAKQRLDDFIAAKAQL